METLELLRDPRTGQFLPGTAACNPSGRPRAALSQARQLCRQHIADAIALLVNVIHDDHARDRDRIAAAEILLERGIGKTVPENLLHDDEPELDQRTRILNTLPEQLRRKLLGVNSNAT